MFGHSDQPDKDAATALDLALQSVALDPEFAPGYSALASAYSASGQNDEAIAAARRAIKLQPGDADAYSYLSRSLFLADRGDEACEAARMAFRLDPQFIAGPVLNLLGRACFVAGRYDEAIEAYQRNADRGGPMHVSNLGQWAAALSAVNRINEANDKVQELLGYDPDFTLVRARTMHRFANEDEQTRLIDGLRKAGLPE
jgi:tetratricopeptide (TPR) repeat protein